MHYVAPPPPTPACQPPGLGRAALQAQLKPGGQSAQPLGEGSQRPAAAEVQQPESGKAANRVRQGLQLSAIPENQSLAASSAPPGTPAAPPGSGSRRGAAG